MTEHERLIDNLNREINGQPWHGPSLASILEGVDAGAAARRPPGGGHTIWEIVLHMTGWKREVTRRVRGGAAAEPAGGDWPAAGEPALQRAILHQPVDAELHPSSSAKASRWWKSGLPGAWRSAQ